MKTSKFQKDFINALISHCFVNNIFCLSSPGINYMHFSLSFDRTQNEKSRIVNVLLDEKKVNLYFQNETSPYFSSSDLKSLFSYIDNAFILHSLTN